MWGTLQNRHSVHVGFQYNIDSSADRVFKLHILPVRSWLFILTLGALTLLTRLSINLDQKNKKISPYLPGSWQPGLSIRQKILPFFAIDFSPLSWPAFLTVNYFIKHNFMALFIHLSTTICFKSHWRADFSVFRLPHFLGCPIVSNFTGLLCRKLSMGLLSHLPLEFV